MSNVRIALANVKIGESAQQSITLALDMIADAARQGAVIVCFPESFVPGYRIGNNLAPCDALFLSHAWAAIDRAASEANIAVILGTERLEGRMEISRDSSLGRTKRRSNCVSSAYGVG